MPRGVYQRSEAQLEAMRERFRAAGANPRPSPEARQRKSDERTQHGHSKRGARSTTYRVWRNMISRCTNPNVPEFARYGGRGIVVCDRWRSSFAAFLADMGERPDGKTLDRKDNDGPHSPDNCHWTTPSAQGRNTRVNRLLTHAGETKCASDWADETGIPLGTITARIDRLGWTVERALTEPLRADRRRGS